MNVFSRMKEKAVTTKDAIVNSKTGMALSIAGGTAVTMMCGTSAFAVTENNVKTLLGTILKIIAVLIVVLGLFMSIMGVVHFAQANSEGDGPAKQKAIMQISAGAMLLIVSIILFTSNEKLVSLIETSI